ncbi:hypothetical protein LJB42_000581 [Komagataella kurtzmanii]|nr:hypothetical protein LJB42_000581 [Komagataella kurtzmanii]
MTTIQPLAPRIQNDSKPITKIVTSKEWVLPPRPKPGRKPSVDTPTTKRKAQNRAAQRAFRERRANRVNELEEKLMELEKEKSIKEGILNNEIKKLQRDKNMLLRRLEKLEKQIGIEGQTDRLLAGNDGGFDTSPQQQISPAPSSTGNAPSSNAPSPNSGYRPESTPYTVDDSMSDGGSDSPDCGLCMKDDCVCASIGVKEGTTQASSMELFKPMKAVPLKRRRVGDDDGNEVDFTNAFKKTSLFASRENNSFVALPRSQTQAQPQQIQNSSSSTGNNDMFATSSAVDTNIEECGFCSDDTPCVCREVAREQAQLERANKELLAETSLPPIINGRANSLTSNARQSLPVLHPGPSVSLKTDAPAISRHPSNKDLKTLSTVVTALAEGESQNRGSCTGNPGTCSQCQRDPMSTLFCTTIASKDEEKAPLPKIQDNVFIPCSDAYKTLSRHANFNEVNFNTLIGKLTTKGMLVEAGSVASVLRELDRKFSNA